MKGRERNVEYSTTCILSKILKVKDDRQYAKSGRLLWKPAVMKCSYRHTHAHTEVADFSSSCVFTQKMLTAAVRCTCESVEHGCERMDKHTQTKCETHKHKGVFFFFSCCSIADEILQRCCVLAQRAVIKGRSNAL